MADLSTRRAPWGLIRAMWDRREVRFLVVGGLNTILGLILFAAAHVALGDHVPYLLLLGPTYGIGVPIAFTTQRVFVFRAHGGNVLGDFARYTLVQLTSIGLNALLLVLFVEVISAPVLVAQALTLGVIIVVTYFGHLLFSFRRHHAE
jgi:putative flippase GtrA